MPYSEALEQTKRALVDQFAAFLADQPAAQLAAFRARIEALLSATSETELSRLVARVADTGSDWGYFPAEAFARRVQRALADVSLSEGSELLAAQRLDRVRARPLVFMPNHVSYSDANLFEILLHRAGYDDIAERLTVIAGPKVYGDPLRRFLSLCFGTIKTAQSKSRASGEAVMAKREVAAVAKKALALSFARLDAGDALLVFGEGARSRTGALQPLLPAVARYLEHPGSVIVPVGITGTERLIPLGDMHLHPSCVRIAVGEPIESAALVQDALGKRPRMVERLGRAIAAVLPPEYRGAYA